MGCCSSSTKVENFKAEMSSQDYEEGVARNRGCTDILFLIIFLAFIGGMGYVAYRGINAGNPYRLIYGYDSWGNVCGMKNADIVNVSESGQDMTSRPQLFFQDQEYFYKKFLPSLGAGAFTLPPSLAGWSPGDILVSTDPIVCVNSCPESTLITGAQLAPYCTYDNTNCPTPPVLPHMSLFHRCIPSSLTALVVSSFKGVMSGDVAQKVFSDITRTWRELLYLAAISLSISLLIVVVLKFLAAIVIWVVTFLMLLLVFAVAAYCWYIWHGLHSIENPTEEDIAETTTWVVYSCTATCVAVIVLLILLVMIKRIKLVIQLFKEAGVAIGRMPLLLIQPLWTLVFLLGVIGALAFIAIYLETAGEATVDSSSGYVTYELDKLMQYLRWYHFFGFLWLSAFVVACQDMVIAGAVSIWYFNSYNGSLGSPICRSICNLLRYHLGTVAFGSFIIAVVRLARFILSLIQKKLHGKTGQIAEFLMKVLQCCLWCFEKFIRFLNRNAYIMTASHGYNFCTGARKGFMLLLANVLRVAALNSIGDFILFLAKIGCAGLSVLIGHQLLNGVELNYIWAPLTVAAAVAFAIAHCFMLVYEISLDTIFLCFCEDCEMNDGVTKPYFMSKHLMQCIDNINEDHAKRMRKKEEKQKKKESNAS